MRSRTSKITTPIHTVKREAIDMDSLQLELTQDDVDLIKEIAAMNKKGIRFTINKVFEIGMKVAKNAKTNKDVIS